MKSSVYLRKSRLTLKNQFFFSSNFVCAAKDSYEGGYALSEMPIEGYGDCCSFPWSGLLFSFYVISCPLIILINVKINYRAAAFYC